MPIPDQSHIVLGAAARPARLGVLVPVALKGVSWVRTFEAALAAQVRYWGGRGNLLFPLSANLTDQELFWELADRFDADAFVTYAPTWRELQEFGPQLYDHHMTKFRAEAGAKFDAEDVDDLARQLDTRIAFDVRPRPEQVALLRRRLAPFHHGREDSHLDSFNGVDAAAWPFTDTVDFADLPSLIVEVTFRGGPVRKLLETAVAGRLPGAVREALEEQGVAVRDEAFGRYEWVRLAIDRARNARASVPWTLADQGLGLYGSAGSTRLPAALVVGNTAWDFCLYYALKRMTGMAWWLPSWLRKDDLYLHSLSTAMQYEAAAQGRDVAVVSASSTKARDEVLKSMSRFTVPSIKASAMDWRDVLPDDPLRYYSRDDEGRMRPMPLRDGALVDLETPIPRHTRTRVPNELRWLTEVQGKTWTPIRHPRVAMQVLGGMHAATELVRTTRDGVAYFSPNPLILGGATLESSVVRPVLSPLPLVEQVRGALEEAGWTCGSSDKGIYAIESMRLFGGFEELCQALRDPVTRSLIDAYRAKHGPGRRLSHDNRRYLTWENFGQVVPDAAVADVIDPLLAAGVLVRGLVLKCLRCRQEAWHPLRAVGDEFECARCGTIQVLERQSWLGTNEPTWSYRLAEVLYQLLEHDGELPLLGVRDAFADSRRPVAYAYELELTSPTGVSLEIDIFSADGYRLWVGEAKKDGRFDHERIQTLASVADVVDAYGVMLTTSKRVWPDSTTRNARGVFDGRWPKLLLLAGVRTRS
jgi:hypothetical protein